MPLFMDLDLDLGIDLDVTLYSFYKGRRRISTTFKVAVSHFVYYPCEALYLILVGRIELCLECPNMRMHEC